MNRREALLTLNVQQDSSKEEIKTAYRKMALELHPDKNQEKKEDGEFKKITEAYNFLKNNKNQDTIYKQTKQLTTLKQENQKKKKAVLFGTRKVLVNHCPWYFLQQN